jgi:hypothetical protein
MKKYAYLNPNDGQYTMFATKEEVVTAAVVAAFEFFIAHTHGKPFAEIEVDEFGAETWMANDGSPIIPPAQILEEAERVKRHLESLFNAQQMPVTTLGDA